LRAEGAYLISTKYNKNMNFVKVFSEKGGTLKMINPFKGEYSMKKISNSKELKLSNKVLFNELIEINDLKPNDIIIMESIKQESI